MITKQDILNNINTEWHISSEDQKEYRYGLCKFIVDICQKINVSQESATLAMLITNYFFIKNCYFNYDKLTIACAALLLSSKNETSQNKFNDICREFSNIQPQGIGSEVLHKIKEYIGKYEIVLLKQLNYNIPKDFPYDLIYGYSELLYPNNSQEISNIAIKIANDSYFTYANNIYKNHVVSLACLVIAAKFLDIPTILDENFKHIDNMKKVYKRNISLEDFNKALIQYDNQNYNNNKIVANNNDDDFFKNLSFYQKLHPFMVVDDLLDCVEMIMEFYEDMNVKSNN